MNKKVKWTIIAVSTATALGFGGLVLNNQNPSSTTNSTSIAENNSDQDNSTVYNETQGQQDRFSQGNHPQRDSEQASVPSTSNDESSISQSSPDQGASWGQDQFQQAPSSGFEQGNGSSGATR